MLKQSFYSVPTRFQRTVENHAKKDLSLSELQHLPL